MATTIKTQGRAVATPGVYSTTDASGLDSTSLGASGVVAVIGEADGGKPVAQIDSPEDILRFPTAQSARDAFRGGPLKEVAPLLFNPANDPDIPGGASEYIAMKVNPATGSDLTIVNDDDEDVIQLESLDFGGFTDQINVVIEDGSELGKKITIELESEVESVDNIGEAEATLEYVNGDNGYDTAVATVDAGVVSVIGTKTQIGRESLILAVNTLGQVEVKSSSAADVGIVVYVVGVEAGIHVFDEFTLNGTTPVTGLNGRVFEAGTVMGAQVFGTTSGSLTVQMAGGGTILFAVGTGTDEVGAGYLLENCHAKGTVTLVADSASVQTVYVLGRAENGSPFVEAITLTNTTPVTGIRQFARIDALLMGDVLDATTVTMTVTAGSVNSVDHSTLTKARDYFDARQRLNGGVIEGFKFTILGDPQTELIDLDPGSASILDAELSLVQDVSTALVDWINVNSSLLSATRLAGVGGPKNTSEPLYLSGGIDGVATFADYLKAISLLRQVRVNTIVDLSGDPAVAAEINAHCAYMAGPGRSERDAVVGVLNAAGTGNPTKAEFKTAAKNLNSRHMRVVGQSVKRFKDGEVADYLPPFLAAIIAGAQAGSSVGTSLTSKYMNGLGLSQDKSWNPVDDSDEMIQAGTCILRYDEVGPRVVRNITTYLNDDNLAFTEASTNEAANYAVFEFRKRFEYIIGQKGFVGTIGVARANATSILRTLVEEEVLADYGNLEISIEGDTMTVSIDMAPVIPQNFVNIKVHLVSQQQLQSGRTNT